jgi:hypothetical protein
MNALHDPAHYAEQQQGNTILLGMRFAHQSRTISAEADRIFYC